MVEALLYGCVAWAPLKGNYQELRFAHHRMLLRIFGAWCRSRHHRLLSYDLALRRTDCESIETTVHTRRLLWAGDLFENTAADCPNGSRWRPWEKTGRRGRGCKEKERMNCVANELRLFGIGDSEGWKTPTLEPCKW